MKGLHFIEVRNDLETLLSRNSRPEDVLNALGRLKNDKSRKLALAGILDSMSTSLSDVRVDDDVYVHVSFHDNK